MSWQRWDQLRKERAELRGKWTSKEGTEKLARAKITLHPEKTHEDQSVEDRTTVRAAGKSLGEVGHPNNRYNPHKGSFQALAYTNTVDAQYGPRKRADDLGAFPTHDSAVEAILKSHDIKPPQVSSATVLADRVSGPRRSSVVAGRYEGGRAAPEKGMSPTARQADSIATRIRMNAARTDPMTGKKLTSDTRSADRLAAKVSKPMSFDRVKKIYGGLLNIHRTQTGRQHVIDRHMSGLAEIPEAHHRLVSRYLADKAEGGIHIGTNRDIDMKGTKVGQLHEAGRRILADRPNEASAGVYSSDVRQLLLSDDEGKSGSVSTAKHELGHAVDYALGRELSGRDVAASGLPHFQQVFNEVTHMHDNSKTRLNPYFTLGSRNHEDSGRKEMFAEAYAAWAHGRQRYKTPDERALLIGHEIGAAPSEKLRVGRVLSNYFDVQDQKIRDMEANR